MKKFGLLVAAIALSLGGCKSTCCRKPACSTCVPPPPAPPVQIYSPSTSNASPEVWLPSPPSSPAAAPTVPAQPQSSNYTPVNPSRIANAPAEVMIGKPEFSETSHRDTTALKTVSNTSEKASQIPFVELTPGRLATGGRPTLDELDRLARGGYRRAYVVAPSGTLNDSDRRVFLSRGLSIELATTVRLTTTEPTYVFADDVTLLRDWWTRYFKETEFLSEDAARIRAARLFH